MRLRLYVPLALALAVPVTARADVPGYRAAVMADGPLAYWHLDEATGTTAVAGQGRVIF